MSTQPWSPEHRAQKTAKIRKESERAAARLGAKGVVMIAFFQDGEYMHMLDAGNAPMALKDLYTQLAGAHGKVHDEGFEGYLS